MTHKHNTFMNNIKYKIAVIGGGAAGFFVAQNLSEIYQNNIEIHIFEGGKRFLEKVRISGGGRCNVTHSPMEPKKLITFYPRGKKELLGAFHRFNCQDTIDWFENRGVLLKVESDGRVFPRTDDSATIIRCLTSCLEKPNVRISVSSKVTGLHLNKDLTYSISTLTENYTGFNFAVFSTGSQPSGFTVLRDLQLEVSDLIPSLFTFHLSEAWPKELMGVSVKDIRIRIEQTKLTSDGDLLFTHWGISGPAVLKMSSFSAKELYALNYRTRVNINWLPALSEMEIADIINNTITDNPAKLTRNTVCFSLPSRLWNSFLTQLAIANKCWSEVSKKDKNKLISMLSNTSLSVNGKSTFKEEFVTCGGVELKEIDLKTFESKRFANLYLAGEVLNIDAVTGGFNFQAAWTGAWHVVRSISEKISMAGKT